MNTTLADMPLTMIGFDEQLSRHYSSIYDQKASAYYDDLSTVWESMYRKGLRKQLSCYYTHQPIDEYETSMLPNGNETRKVGKDLARVHHERALDAGKLRRDRARRWRRKNHSTSLESQSSQSSSQSSWLNLVKHHRLWLLQQTKKVTVFWSDPIDWNICQKIRTVKIWKIDFYQKFS